MKRAATPARRVHDKSSDASLSTATVIENVAPRERAAAISGEPEGPFGRNTVMFRILALFAPLVLAGCSVFGVRTAPEPPFTVVDRPADGIEVRRYPARVAAEVRLAADQGRPESRAFGLLFDYISGANAAEEKIAMTAPVEQAGTEIAMTAPVEMGRQEEGFVMRFFLPEEFTPETAPVPTDPAVELVELSAEHVAVEGFTGWWTRAGVERRQADLLARLEDTAWQPAGAPVAWFYDPPWTLPFLRRNEIVVPVERRS